jgi:hypothetical protein
MSRLPIGFRSCLSACLLVTALLHSTGQSQDARRPRLMVFPPDSSKAKGTFLGLQKGDMVLVKGARKPTSAFVVGDTILIGASHATLTDMSADRLGQGQFDRNDSLVKLESMRLELSLMQTRIRDSLIGRWENVHRIDSTAFHAMQEKYRRANDLITRSTRNTERAIRQSYYTSALVGAAGGGVAGAMTEDKVVNALIGAGIGALAGPCLNWALVELSARIWP